MKTVVSEKKCEEEIKYPCLMTNGEGGNALLMIKDREGTWISGPNIGQQEKSLIMSVIVPFHGSVCLEND